MLRNNMTYHRTENGLNFWNFNYQPQKLIDYE